LINLQNLTHGVDRLFIENPRFTTTLISVNFYMPLTKRGLASYSLLTSLMAASCKKYPDFSSLNLRQKELYSIDLNAMADKTGDIQMVKFYTSYLNDGILEESIEKECNDLLLELIFNPLVENGEFLGSEIAREKRLILEKIKSLYNEKRSYSVSKLVEKMFENTPYATLSYGDKEDLEEINGKELYDAYIYMLQNAYIRIQVIAKEYNGGFDKAFTKAIAPFREEKNYIPQKSKAKISSGVLEFSEKSQINQAKLCLGFTAEEFISSMAVNVFADVFGGGPYSYLFSNVREKLSLCYYCAARLQKKKGLIIVDSGVEKENIEKAKAQIIIEKDKIANGEISDELIETSKKALLESLKSRPDNDLSLDGWYASKADNDLKSIEEVEKELAAVTKEDVINVAKKFKLDTVFTLMPEEN